MERAPGTVLNLEKSFSFEWESGRGVDYHCTVQYKFVDIYKLQTVANMILTIL